MTRVGPMALLITAVLVACSGGETNVAGPSNANATDTTQQIENAAEEAARSNGEATGEAPASDANGSARTAPTEPSGTEPSGSTRPPEPTGIVESVKPACAARTETITVTARTVPLADITYGASFSDGKHHGIFGLAQADVNGVWVLRFPVPLDAALGDGQVAVAAIHPDGGGGDGKAPFRVIKDDRC